MVTNFIAVHLTYVSKWYVVRKNVCNKFQVISLKEKEKMLNGILYRGAIYEIMR